MLSDYRCGEHPNAPGFFEGAEVLDGKLVHPGIWRCSPCKREAERDQAIAELTRKIDDLGRAVAKILEERPNPATPPTTPAT